MALLFEDPRAHGILRETILLGLVSVALLGCGRIGFQVLDSPDSDSAVSDEVSDASRETDLSDVFDAPDAPDASDAVRCDDSMENGLETDVDCGGVDCPPCANGADCMTDLDCKSALCAQGVCRAPSCDDGLLNQDETDVDCGGEHCSACPNCSDEIQNGDESDVDCGGATCESCDDGGQCHDDSDCESGVCEDASCAEPACEDSVLNQDETDVDCGGQSCSPCDDDQACERDEDCQSGVCDDETCQTPTCTDGTLNQDESDVDCGGDSCPVCPTCEDGIQNQDETDVDCGGDSCPACPTCQDGVQNQDETDVDCGGDSCPACPTCQDGVQNQDETDVDCGGVCSDCPSCSDFILNQDETEIDCGGTICPPCGVCTWQPFNEPEMVTGLGSSGELFGPSLSSDALTLYFAELDDDEERIYSAARSDRGTVFSAAVEVDTINSSGQNGTPFISANGKTIYFFSTRPGGMGGRDIMFSRRPNNSSTFPEPLWLSNVNSSAADHFPVVTPNEKTIFLSSTRSGGAGGSDLWIAQRSHRDDDFPTPSNLSELNTDEREESPALTPDMLTIHFISNRTGGSGSDDIWYATRSDKGDPFSAPENLTAVNSADSELDVAISIDGRELFFVSTRSGNHQIWRSIRECL